jgi:hypothetical protein
VAGDTVLAKYRQHILREIYFGSVLSRQQPYDCQRTGHGQRQSQTPICFLSYGRQNDNSTYEASVATAPTANEAIAAATNLAAAGYIITGFGGNTLNGYVMVGTRVNGNATPRPLQVVQSTGSLPSQGYVQVASVSDATSGTNTFIFEK